MSFNPLLNTSIKYGEVSDADFLSNRYKSALMRPAYEPGEGFKQKLIPFATDQLLPSNCLTAYLDRDYDNDGTLDIPESDLGMSWAYFGWGLNSSDTGGVF